MAASNLTFRVASTHDVPAMVACRSADAGEGEADWRMQAYFDGHHHPQNALRPRVGYLALDGDRVIGYIGGHRTTRLGFDGEVQYLFVASAFRRRGTGTALLRRLAQWFVEQSVSRVCVAVADDSPPEAKPFFTSAGASELKRHWYGWEDIRLVLREQKDSSRWTDGGANHEYPG